MAAPATRSRRDGPRPRPKPYPTDRNDGQWELLAPAGVIEVAIDTGKANTVGDWRDVKVAVICKRPVGTPASADGCANRRLPAPTARAVAANVEDSVAFADRVRAETNRLDATTAADGTVRADGAEWIGNPADDVRPQAAGVLDFYHLAEHVADAVTAVLTGGKAGLERWIGAAFGVLPAGVGREALRALVPHPTSIDG